MGDKVKPRQGSDRSKGHGVPKKGWRSQAFKFGKKRDRKDRRGVMDFAWCIVLSAVLTMSLLCAACTSYKGGKLTEGTDIAIGMTIPQSGGTFQIDALNLVTGFRFLFAEDAGVKCVYCVTNTVTAFGFYNSTTVKSVDIELTPTVNEADGGEGDENGGTNDGVGLSPSK